jgi:hypothetical protein
MIPENAYHVILRAKASWLIDLCVAELDDDDTETITQLQYASDCLMEGVDDPLYGNLKIPSGVLYVALCDKPDKEPFREMIRGYLDYAEAVVESTIHMPVSEGRPPLCFISMVRIMLGTVKSLLVESEGMYYGLGGLHLDAFMSDNDFLLHPEDDVHAEDDLGTTPVELAVASGSTETVSFLLKHGASIDRAARAYVVCRAFFGEKVYDFPDLLKLVQPERQCIALTRDVRLESVFQVVDMMRAFHCFASEG